MRVTYSFLLYHIHLNISFLFPSLYKLKDTDDGGDKDGAEEGQVGAEVRSVGSVKASIYLQYFLAGGGWFLLIVLFLANVITQVLFSGTDYWLSYW